MSEENERVSDRELKVTDKRMFTADGELRAEYRHLDDEVEKVAERAPTPPAPGAGVQAEAEPTPEPPAPPSATDESPGQPVMPQIGEPGEDSPRLEIPSDGLGSPTFLDLVTLLAEPIALYLGDAELPDGKSAENLEMARLHIDLLDVLRHKTAGNLEAGEARLLEDLLYRCRLRYVQKRG